MRSAVPTRTFAAGVGRERAGVQDQAQPAQPAQPAQQLAPARHALALALALALAHTLADEFAEVVQLCAMPVT